MSGHHPTGSDARGDPATAPELLAWLDAFGASHPKLMVAATVLSAILATLVMLASAQGAAVLYQAF